MFKKSSSKAHPLDAELDRAMKFIVAKSPDSPEYAAALDQIEKLTKIKAPNAATTLSKDTLVTAATNLAGIVMVIGHERIHVIATKALGLVMKAR